MPGSIAANTHEGTRSEILAQYLFTAWGTVTPVRQQDDHGLDLYCTITERIGKVAWVRESFTVQVKSEGSALEFGNGDAVSWFANHPSPLLLCVVNKAGGRIRIYHTMQRFLLSALQKQPETLVLKPSHQETGNKQAWEGGEFEIGPPIIEVSGEEVFDKDRLEDLRLVLGRWLEIERANLDSVRRGSMQCLMPTYATNACPTVVATVRGFRFDDETAKRDLIRLAEALDLSGDHLCNRGDATGAIIVMLLLYWLRKSHSADLGWQVALLRSSSLTLLQSELMRLASEESLEPPHRILDELVAGIQTHRLVASILGTQLE